MEYFCGSLSDHLPAIPYDLVECCDPNCDDTFNSLIQSAHRSLNASRGVLALTFRKWGNFNISLVPNLWSNQLRIGTKYGLRLGVRVLGYSFKQRKMLRSVSSMRFIDSGGNKITSNGNNWVLLSQSRQRDFWKIVRNIKSAKGTSSIAPNVDNCSNDVENC